MIRVTGTNIVGQLECALDANLILTTETWPYKRAVRASMCEVVPGSEDADVDAEVLADAMAREAAGS